MPSLLLAALALSSLALVQGACVNGGCMAYSFDGTASQAGDSYHSGCYSTGRCVNRLNDGTVNSGTSEWLIARGATPGDIQVFVSNLPADALIRTLSWQSKMWVVLDFGATNVRPVASGSNAKCLTS